MVPGGGGGREFRVVSEEYDAIGYFGDTDGEGAIAAEGERLKVQ